MSSIALRPAPPRDLEVNLLGNRAILRSSFAPFMQYAGTHLSVMGATREEWPIILDSTLHWHDGPPPADLRADRALREMERIDRDLYCGNDRLAWFRIDACRDLVLRAVWEGARLQVRGDFYFYLSRNPQRDRVKRLLYRTHCEIRQRNRFRALVYYLVYYPVFWWCETLRGAHPLHASGVVTEQGAIVIAGASGVGKTTLALALAESGAPLLSETFLLHRGTDVWAVREPFLLDRWSRDWLGDAMRGMEPLRERYVFEREAFHRRHGLADQGTVSLVVLPRRAPQTYVRPIATEEAAQRISASNQLVRDFRRYSVFAAAFEALAPRGLGARREEALRRLTAGARCVEMGLAGDVSRHEAVRLLRELTVTPLPAVRRAGRAES